MVPSLFVKLWLVPAVRFLIAGVTLPVVIADRVIRCIGSEPDSLFAFVQEFLLVHGSDTVSVTLPRPVIPYTRKPHRLIRLSEIELVRFMIDKQLTGVNQIMQYVVTPVAPIHR